MKRNDNPLSSAAERGIKSTLLGIFVNLGLALIKCLAGLLGDSFALVAVTRTRQPRHGDEIV